MTKSVFAFRATHKAKPIFGSGEAKLIEERGVIEAEDAEAAVKAVVKRSSVAAIHAGLTIQVVPVDFSAALIQHAWYTAEPLLPNHAGNPKCELKIGNVP